MRNFVLSLLVVFLCQVGIAQGNKSQEVEMVSHTVQMGETVRMLSKKYLVNPSEIYRYNKFAVDGISNGMVLQIPVPKKEPVIQEEPVVENQSETASENEVQSQEPVAEVEKPKTVRQKPKSKPVTGKPVAEKSEPVINSDSEREHTIVAGETLYSLSRTYNVPVEDIKQRNTEAVKKGLKVGQVVKIPVGNTSSTSESTAVTGTEKNVSEGPPASHPEKTIIEEPAPTKTIEAITPAATEENSVIHKVGPKETLYSLSKQFGMTVDEIKAQNPDVAKHGLQIGQTLTIKK